MTRFGAILLTALLLLLWTGVVASGALHGCWSTPLAPAGDIQGFIRGAAALIVREKPGNTALVLVENVKIKGEYSSQTPDAVDQNTVLATASMSKWIASLGVM
jgi:CubicO group peptidase (beta-lactamase class C family)